LMLPITVKAMEGMYTSLADKVATIKISYGNFIKYLIINSYNGLWRV